MIVKINFPKNGINYLLSSVDSKGCKRPSEIIGGSLPGVLALLTSAKRYKNPCITFTCRDPNSFENLGGYKFEEKFVDEFLETIFPGFDKSTLPYLIIRHHNEDKSYELNFFVVNMQKGKQYTTYFDSRDKPGYKAFGRMIHQENPALADPCSPKYARYFVPNEKWNYKQEQLYEEIIMLPESKKLCKGDFSKADYLKELHNKGYLISGISETGAIIANEEVSICLKGPVMRDSYSAQQFQSYKEEAVKSKENYRERWVKSCQERHDSIFKKHKNLTKEIYERKKYKYENREQTPEVLRDPLSQHEYNNGREYSQGNEPSRKENIYLGKPEEGAYGSSHRSRKEDSKLGNDYFSNSGEGPSSGKLWGKLERVCGFIEELLRPTTKKGVNSPWMVSVVREMVDLFQSRNMKKSIVPKRESLYPTKDPKFQKTLQTLKEFRELISFRDTRSAHVIQSMAAYCLKNNIRANELLSKMEDISTPESFKTSWEALQNRLLSKKEGISYEM